MHMCASMCADAYNLPGLKEDQETRIQHTETLVYDLSYFRQTQTQTLVYDLPGFRQTQTQSLVYDLPGVFLKKTSNTEVSRAVTYNTYTHMQIRVCIDTRTKSYQIHTCMHILHTSNTNNEGPRITFS